MNEKEGQAFEANSTTRQQMLLEIENIIFLYINNIISWGIWLAHFIQILNDGKEDDVCLLFLFSFFRNYFTHMDTHSTACVPFFNIPTANIENYTKSYKKERYINDRISKVKPQNPILLIVFDVAFAKVKRCRWVNFFCSFDEFGCVCLMSAWNTISISNKHIFDIMDYGQQVGYFIE